MPRRCTYEDCFHASRRERIDCRAGLRRERLIELEQKEQLIMAEKIALLMDAERDRDLPMPGYEAGSDDCPRCRALRAAGVG